MNITLFIDLIGYELLHFAATAKPPRAWELVLREEVGFKAILALFAFVPLAPLTAGILLVLVSIFYPKSASDSLKGEGKVEGPNWSSGFSTLRAGGIVAGIIVIMGSIMSGWAAENAARAPSKDLKDYLEKKIATDAEI